MGKVKRLRQKYHLSLKKTKSTNNLNDKDESKKETPAVDNPVITNSENIFSGIDISLDTLNQSLPKDFDVRSIASTKSRKELKEEERHLKKKEKLKLRHERFIRKLDITNQLMKNSKKKGSKKKKPQDDFLTSFLKTLPSDDTKVKPGLDNKNYEKPKPKPRGILKAKQRLKQQSKDTKVFKKILNDKTFQKNPLETISQFIKEKVAMAT